MDELTPRPSVAYHELSGHRSCRWDDLMIHPTENREVKALDSTMDFRDVRYRREVFIRFYLFHLQLRAHPGCVYYLMPHLFGEVGTGNLEDKLWFAFINGCTQNPVTSLSIFREFPKVPRTPYQLEKLTEWFNEHWAVLPFDTDRRYQKKEFPKAVLTYSVWLNGRTQNIAFAEAINYGTAHDDTVNFDLLWKLIQSTAFWGFGRLGTWSYMEYLFIMGLPLEPSSMMLRDMSGSKSHRNGLAIVLGRDDLDWTKTSPFQGRYSKEVLAWMEEECDLLLAETRARSRGMHWERHVSRFTLESALCTYKGWHRPNRRYPNVYNDMLLDRIRQAEKLRPGEDFTVFWQARAQCLPMWARQEDDSSDPGLAPSKQNHYRLTGKIPMMDRVWSVFKHDETWRLKR